MRFATLTALSSTALASAFANAASTTGNNRPPAPTIVGTATGIAMPERNNTRGSASLYPFDDLDVGGSFGVKDRDKRGLTSVISNQNRKHKVHAVDADGNKRYETKTASDGQGGTVEVPDTSKPIMETGKHFVAFDVDADLAKQIKGTPLEGSKVVVFRDK